MLNQHGLTLTNFWMTKWTERTSTLSIMVLGWTAIDTKSFTSMAMALLRPCGWLEIAFFKYMLLWRSKNGAFPSHTTSSIFSIIYSKSNPTILAGVTALHLFYLRHLWMDGPNGRYLALVLSVRGPSISRLYYCNIRLYPCIARSI